MNRVFLDANILVDYLSNKANDEEELNTRLIIEYCYEHLDKAFVSTHSIMVLYHLVDKEFDEKFVLKEKLQELCELFNIVTVDEQDMQFAFNSMMNDFEDAVQVSCAINANTDFIVTKNIADFYGDELPFVITPDQFFYFSMSTNPPLYSPPNDDSHLYQTYKDHRHRRRAATFLNKRFPSETH